MGIKEEFFFGQDLSFNFFLGFFFVFILIFSALFNSFILDFLIQMDFCDCSCDTSTRLHLNSNIRLSSTFPFFYISLCTEMCSHMSCTPTRSKPSPAGVRVSPLLLWCMKWELRTAAMDGSRGDRLSPTSCRLIIYL